MNYVCSSNSHDPHVYRSLGSTWHSDNHEHKQQCHQTNLDSSFHSGHHGRRPRHATLDNTCVDPDISSYTVYITNTNTSKNGTVSVTELDGNGVVETEYTFTGLPGEDPDPCLSTSSQSVRGMW